MKKINCIILAILAAVLLVSCGSENRKLEEISVQGQSPVAGKEKPEEREEIGVVRLKWRSYDSHREFPYGNMEYVDEETYAFLKRTYDEIDFAGEYQMGNPELYEEYINEYKKLVDNEITFTEPETGEVCYIKDFPAFRPYHDEECDPGKFRYFLFDMDGDNAPELCIWDVETYIFKYDSKSETMTLWMEIPTYNEHVHGTKALSWDWDGVRYRFMRIDGEGKVVFEVYFLIEGFWSNGIVTYMMSMPFYDGKQVEMPEGMEKQGYFDEESDLYLFQVTEEQFDELTRDYFKALKESEEERGKVTYTYEELFGADDGVNAENGLWGTDGTPCMVTMVICHSVPSFMICVNSFMKRLL